VDQNNARYHGKTPRSKSRRRNLAEIETAWRWLELKINGGVEGSSSKIKGIAEVG
jgi:hypothetical protein